MQSGEWLRPVIGPRNGTSAQCSRGERELPDGGLRYRERFADGARQRRIGIVAVARKLSIALGRYLETGAPPEGAVRKPNAPQRTRSAGASCRPRWTARVTRRLLPRSHLGEAMAPSAALLPGNLDLVILKAISLGAVARLPCTVTA